MDRKTLFTPCKTTLNNCCSSFTCFGSPVVIVTVALVIRMPDADDDDDDDDGDDDGGDGRGMMDGG